MERGTVMRALGAAAIVVLTATPADAFPIYTAPLEEVVPHASHVVRVACPARPDGRFDVVAVYRGALDGEALLVHGLPPAVTRPLRLGTFRPAAWSRSRREETLGSLVLALYALDGRYHVVAARRGHDVPPHSSVRLVSATNRVYALRQVINPGGPMPVPAEPPDLADFEVALTGLLARRPFEGFRHRALPEVERERFLALVEPDILWYERGLANREMTSPARIALARRLHAYALEAPEAMTVHAFDAIQMLAPTNHAAHGHEAEIARLLTDLVRLRGVAPFEGLILDELEHGIYMQRSRSVLLRVAKATDADLYRRALEVLVALGKRVYWNEGLDALRALRENGETVLADEVEAVQTAVERRDDEAAGLPPADVPPSQEDAAAPAAELPPPARPEIRSGDAAPAPREPPITAAADTARGGGRRPLPLEPVLLGAVVALALLLFGRRRR